MKKIIRLTESDLTKLVKRVLSEQKNLLLEFTAPQGLIQTIKTPIDKLEILGCKNEPCDSILYVKGDGGTFKYKVEIKTMVGSTGLKYRDFKKIPSGYQFIGLPTNKTVAAGTWAAYSTDTTIGTVEYKSTTKTLFTSNPFAKLQVKDLSGKEVMKPTPFVWNPNAGKYSVNIKVPAPGKYKEIFTTQNKPESNFYGTSELLIYFSNSDIKKIQTSLISTNGEKGTFEQTRGTIVLTYQP